MPLPALDRWERKLQARGGCVQRRSGRYTKPGYRPRAVEVGDVDVREHVPGRIVTCYDPGTTDGSVYPVVSQWWWGARELETSATTTSSIWLNTEDTTSSATCTIPISWRRHRGYPTMEQIPPSLTPEHVEEIKRAHRKEEFRRRIRAQIIGGEQYDFYDKRRHADFTQVSQPEIVALQLLKRMLSFEGWRRYLRYGFIVVASNVTGLDYQVFRGGGHIKVYRRGKPVAELCIHISDRKTPPTDRVIAKKIMLEASELEVWLKSNIYNCQELGYHNKPTIENLISLGAEALAHNVRSKAAAGRDRPVIFTPEAARRSMEPICTVGRTWAEEFVRAS